MGGKVSPGVRVLFIAKQKKNVDTFETTIAALLARGHHVTLAIQERDLERDRRLAERMAHDGFTVVACPEERGDRWRRSAPLIRSARDWAHYYQPPYARASKLHQRALTRLLRELGASATLDVDALPLSIQAGGRLRDALAQVEDSIPADPLHEEFIARHAPDVLLVTPGLHFGSGQTDFIKAARARQVPVWMLLFSWDNLSTKGALHARPDRLFVWNARQVQEAAELHGYPAERVTIVGAPRFDEFFALRSQVSRDAFFAPMGLDPRRRTLLYLCSSRFIAAEETSFIRTWLAALRASAAQDVSDCNVIVRPHPDVPLDTDIPTETITWRQLPQASGFLHRPFGDPQAVVLRTTYSTPQAFYECLHHADAVVALNTSAELEAGIAGRPVLTVLATGEAADGQAHTLHFDYLLRDHGGFVRYAPHLDTHVAQLADTLATPGTADTIRAFVLQFLRPLGDAPVAPRLANALSEAFDALSAVDAAEQAGTPETVPTRGLADANDREKGTEHGESLTQTIKVLTVDRAPGIRILGTPDTKRVRRRGQLLLDPAVADWLDGHVGPGDVFYDVGAGLGAYSLVAAITRGALAVAFEPGFAAYKTLCDNVRLNDATHGVLTLPVALGDRVGLFELEFSGAVGGDGHALRNREWKARREARDDKQGQPVCAERLDGIPARYGVPAPHALRVAVRREGKRVLDGAATLLTGVTLRHVLVTVARRDEVAAVLATLTDAGFVLSQERDGGDLGYSVMLSRPDTSGTGQSRWQQLRQAVGRR